ncbi:MAG: chemotaxis-specific protein-glutamate methyltransferase CheB [Acidobacteria bacterium]|nr:chemotaxis-specific protein-glutamate methyltransferase CheB [Acidobacteriota bacterium]
MNRLRVLVVEDSATIRSYLTGVLRKDPSMEVIGEAVNGREAVEMCARLKPDVITMDMMLPEMNGVLATEQIMAYNPTPILIVSASVNRGEAFRTYDALAAGAVDVLEKPHVDEDGDGWEKRFLSTVRIVSRIKVITHPRGKLRAQNVTASGSSSQPAASSFTPAGRASGKIDLIAIGASTGGPAALVSILAALSPKFPLPVLVVLHISDLFAFAFADWLGGQIALPVRMAKDGERLPQKGTPGVVLAPAGRHMIVDGGRIQLTTTEERNSCRPSIDELFDSVAREVGERAAMVLLTGMGKDGAQGLLSGRKAGAETIAQDEASSIVFGMPGEAVRLGAASHVLPLDGIAGYLKKLAGEASIER